MTWKLLKTHVHRKALDDNELTITEKGIFFKKEINDMLNKDAVMIFVDKELNMIKLTPSEHIKNSIKISKSGKDSFIINIPKPNKLKKGRFKIKTKDGSIIIKQDIFCVEGEE